MTDKASRPLAGFRGALVVRLCNWVGEVVLSVPAIQRLSSAGYAVHLYGKRWAPALLEGLALPITVRDDDRRLAIRQLRELRSQLAAAHPGAAPRALLFTRSFSSAAETGLAGLKPVGYAYDGRQLFLHEAYRRPRDLHAGAEYWQVVNAFLRDDQPFPTALNLPPSPAQMARARQLLAQAGIDPGSYMLLCPFSGSDDRTDQKVWPGFGDLTRRLLSEGRTVVVCPGPGEENLASMRTPGAVLFPGLDLGIYAALLAMAEVAVSNDTGPGHLAAGVGARLVCIHGPPSTAAWTPVGPRVTLFQYGPGWASVDDVAKALAG